MQLQIQQHTRMVLGARFWLTRNTVAAAGGLALSSTTRLFERQLTEDHRAGSTVSLVGRGY